MAETSVKFAPGFFEELRSDADEFPMPTDEYKRLKASYAVASEKARKTAAAKSNKAARDYRVHSASLERLYLACVRPLETALGLLEATEDPEQPSEELTTLREALKDAQWEYDQARGILSHTLNLDQMAALNAWDRSIRTIQSRYRGRVLREYGEQDAPRILDVLFI